MPLYAGVVEWFNTCLLYTSGRFHYHFEIGCPTADEVRAYMMDALGSGMEEEIEKVVKLSQVADITYDSLRAIAFDLKQGYPCLLYTSRCV